MRTFENSAKGIRDQMRMLTTESLLHGLIAYLQGSPKFQGTEQVSTPWVVLLAINWTLELQAHSGNKLATPKDVMSILNAIWNTQHLALGDNQAPIEVQIRALLIPQIKFQKSLKSMVYSFIRIKLILESNQSNGSKFKRDFYEKHRVNFDVYIEIGFFIAILTMNEKKKFFSYSMLICSLTPKYGISEITKVINILGQRLSGLIEMSKAEVTRAIPNSEYFKESVFCDYPLLITNDGITIIHPCVVMMGVTESPIRSFIRKDDSKRQLFTKCFEDYIDSLHEEFLIAALRENQIKELYSSFKAQNRKVADFLITEGISSIIIDAKGVDPKNYVLSAVKRFDISKFVRDQHLKAIEQIIETIDVLSKNKYSGLACIGERYGLVITHHDFFLGTGARIFQFLDDKSKDKIINQANDNVELKNIHFMSIDQYECLLCICSETKSSLGSFFNFVSECESDHRKYRMTMDQYLEDFSEIVYGYCSIPNGSSNLLREKDALFSKLLDALNYNQNYWKQYGKMGDIAIATFIDMHKQFTSEL
jgi:hypothetical protein